MPTLSICIPTYNRSACLAELLESIVAQGMPEVEVVVSDDGSPDDTADVARLIGKRIPKFKFLHQPTNIGVDRNVAAVTAAATGDYIWLIGDDDRLEPGGVRKALDALARWPGVIGLTVGVIDYDVTMRQVTGVRAMPNNQRINGRAAVFAQIGELLGFISAMIVDRRKWQAACADPRARTMTNLYSPVYIMGLAMGQSGSWGVVSEPCVGFRSGNDQLKRRVGWLERLKVDVRGYDEIAAMLFPNDPATRRAMAKRVLDTHIVARIVNAKSDGEPVGELVQAARYLIARYALFLTLWTVALPILLLPAGTVRGLRTGYRHFVGSSGTARARAMAKRHQGNRKAPPLPLEEMPPLPTRRRA